MEQIPFEKNTMNDDNWEKDLKTIKEKLIEYPEDGYLWLEYGDFLHDECDNPAKTVRAYRNAARLLEDKDLRLRLGVAYDRAGQTEKGILTIKESLDENPRANGYCILADVYLKNNMFMEAQSACEKAIEMDPHFEEAYYLMGEALKLESPERAIECYRKAIEFDPAYQLSWHALGRELAGRMESIEEGIEALRIAVELDPQDGWAQITLANALWRKGQIHEADEWYKSAIEVYPDYPEFRKWYNQFLKSQKQE